MIRTVLWWSGSKTDPVTIVLVRDEAGEWRDEVLLTTDGEVSAEILGPIREIPAITEAKLLRLG